MVAKPQELLKDIGSSDANVRLRAVKELKNQIIGNKHKKLSFIKLGAVPRVIELLASGSDANLLVQSATAVGSFGLVDDGVKAIMQHKGIDCLYNSLSSEDPRLVEAAARSLKLIYQSAPPTPITADLATTLPKHTMQRLAELLSSSVADTAASVLAKCCTSSETAQQILAAGALPALVSLFTSEIRNRQEAALEALAALTAATTTRSSAAGSSTGGSPAPAAPSAPCQQLLSSPALLQQLQAFLRSGQPKHKVPACTIISCLATSAPSDSPAAEQLRALSQLALPCLIRLLSDPEHRQHAPLVLSDLLQAQPQLHLAASDAGAIKQLSACLLEPACGGPMLAGVLRALAVLCMDQEQEERRAQLAEPGIVAAVTKALDAPEPSVRAAAALCIRAMSRSIRSMTRPPSLVDPGAAAGLVRLLQDADSVAQSNAAMAVCNLVLEFSPARGAVVAAGGIPALAALASSMFPVLRLNSCWALSNLAFRSETDIKLQVMRELRWADMRSLLSDEDPEVQEHALALLRNLCMHSASDAQAVVAWAQGELVPALEDKMDPSSSRSTQPDLVCHALYTLSNLASGNNSHKDALCASNVPSLLLHHLKTGSMSIKLGALWCVINLVSTADGQDASSRAQKLRDIGVLEQLKAMTQTDGDADVMERAKAAVEAFK